MATSELVLYEDDGKTRAYLEGEHSLQRFVVAAADDPGTIKITIGGAEGDLVRSAVTGRPEDEPDLQRIVVREAVFTDLATAYLEGANPWIDDRERTQLVDGALVITFEQALRFVTDYLVGDAYYPIDDDEHNLRRARAQLRLLDALLAHEDDLRSIVARS